VSLLGRGERPHDKGPELSGSDPTDRAENAMNYYRLVTAAGSPRAVSTNGANRYDSMLVQSILDNRTPDKG
jgi:hypothetical protein